MAVKADKETHGIRLGLCCQFREQPIKFRNTTVKHARGLSRRQRLQKLAYLCSENAAALRKALEYCLDKGIGDFRVNSQILPLKSHPEVGYNLDDLPGGAEIIEAFKDCGRLARWHGLRMSMHPDQFILLSSSDKRITEKAVTELEYHAEVCEWLGADVINIHGGGAYGDKQSALQRVADCMASLPERVKKRLTLENDDRVYTPKDLLPLCRETGVPLVYDVHHHRCLRDGLSEEAATAAALQTWGREPMFHISSPIEGWDGVKPQRHHDLIDPADFPECWRDLQATIEVEAKMKERAVLALKKYLDKAIGCILTVLTITVLAAGCAWQNKTEPQGEHDLFRQTGSRQEPIEVTEDDALGAPVQRRDSVASPGNGYGATLAFGRLSAAAGRSLADVAGELGLIQRLSPDHAILFHVPSGVSNPRLSDILNTRVSVPSRQLHKASSFAVVLTAKPVPVIALDLHPLFAAGTDQDAGGRNERSARARDLANVLKTLSQSDSLIVTVAGGVSRLRGSEEWQSLHQILAESQQQVTVVIASGELFSSWVKDGVRYISLNDLAEIDLETGDIQSGKFAGLLWVYSRQTTAPAFNIFGRRWTLGLSDIQLADQLLVSQLNASLKATPLDDLEPITTVSLKNVTDKKLNFSARWNFDQSHVEVFPQITGFQLDPGENYEQEFRVSYPAEQTVRAVNPQLELRTHLKTANGTRRGLTLTASPWCRIGGRISFFANPLVVDGQLDEWEADEYFIGRPSQVVEGKSAWSGARDISGGLQVGWRPGYLLLGVTVSDDMILGRAGMDKATEEKSTVYLGCNNEPAHRLQVWSNGEYKLEQPSEGGLQPEVAVNVTDTGYAFEAKIPFACLESSESGRALEEFRLEMVLDDLDKQSGTPKRLVLSGRLGKQGKPVRELFARFIPVPRPVEKDSEASEESDNGN
ncbi:MAG: UV DNA damage repair endonuclease UvsE [Lentisphaeria bacterium]